MLLAACNRQWLAAGTVFSEARSRGIIVGKEGGEMALGAAVGLLFVFPEAVYQLTE